MLLMGFFCLIIFPVYLNLFTTIPLIIGIQCIDRHWKKSKEFIGSIFPRKFKGNFGSKMHPEIDTLIK